MPTPVVYVTDTTYEQFDPADLFDLAYLLCSDEYTLQAVILPELGDGERILHALAVRSGKSCPIARGQDGLLATLQQSDTPVNLVVVAGYSWVATLVTVQRELVREKVARIFLVGGHANDYTQGREGEHLPIDPRLMERNPECFSSTGERRLRGAEEAFTTLLTSGEGVIWLPRDICLWRYAASSLLAGQGELTEFLLRELFYANLALLPDRYSAANAPVLLSTLPALLLATKPDPFLWMRLFRALTARVTVEPSGRVTAIETKTDRPNLYAVIAIDSKALSERFTQVLQKPLRTVS